MIKLKGNVTRLLKIGVFFVVCSVLTSLVFANADHKLSQRTKLKQLVKNNQTIQLKFKDSEVKEVLSFFSEAFGLNIVSHPQVVGPISFDFSKISIHDAFDAMLVSQGFDWHIDNKVIYVYPQQPIEIFHLNYADASDVLDSLNAIVSVEGSISVNESDNTIVVQSPYEDIVKIKKLIHKLDVRPRQILVSVKIVEMQADYGFDLGTEFNIERTEDNFAKTHGFADEAAASNQGLFVQAISGDITGYVEALATNKDTEVLAEPKILAVNHKESSIITGSRLGYKTDVFSSEGTLLSQTVEFLEVGTKLSFTPHISSDNDILMEIKPEVSEGDIIDGIPQEETTETSATVLVKNGQTIMIGGLIREKKRTQVSGFPILMDLPLLGHFFKNTSEVSEKRETIVFITPQIIDIDNPTQLLEK